MPFRDWDVASGRRMGAGGERSEATAFDGQKYTTGVDCLALAHRGQGGPDGLVEHKPRIRLPIQNRVPRLHVVADLGHDPLRSLPGG